ncbi:hypothetical protein ACIQD3_22750 [Peribacillus loiseleuriae]|uniref:hypothetical protein n=1 Tax=Peribacillus loiseleuriae TaxID=1679170 RepID=UPI003830569B
MSKIYAQIVNGKVNLIGGEEVGLPLNNHLAISIDITNLVEKSRPKEGWFYRNGIFSKYDDIKPPEPSPIEQLQNENAELWYQNMLFERKLTTETAAIWYEIMMGGNA